MRISLVTSGGITGRGIGAIAIDGVDVVVDGTIHSCVSHDDRERLEALVQLSDAHGAEPTRRPDAVIYRLAIEDQEWSWEDLSNPSPELIALTDELLRIRDRILGQTSFSQ